MKLVLSFGGSRGDVQPGIALAVHLLGRGHEVVVAVPPNLVEFATAAGVSAHPCGDDTDNILGSELVSKDLKSRNPLRRLNAVSELTLRGGRSTQQTLMDLTSDADVIVGSSVGQERSLNVAEKRRIPYVPIHYCPVRRNGVVSMVSVASGLSAPITRASWTVLEQVLWLATRRTENELRAHLGLRSATTTVAARLARLGTPEIQAYDSALFPGLVTEWGSTRPLVGFLDLSPTTRRRLDRSDADHALDRWLDAGPPPVYVGFGSMTVPDPERIGAAIVAAAAATGRRVLVTSGWSNFMGEHAGGSDILYVTPSVDHSRILPRCVAAVHHGGAGSTAAGLRAGLPTLVCWFGADQPMWGRQITEAGVGASLPVRAVTEQRMTDALADVLRSDRVGAATTLRDRLTSAADAVDAAANVIESVVRSKEYR
ncbi:glycosyltransferase [Actinomycetes bacterium M1A6_2h]